ncbi:aspartate racemase/maleate isomerase family protein [Aidingimonas lacisalsi]|uniref:aspartate racemase/maleate isomerase family protein n=1 Tax=Aidingimonas lacisalsi TaxID=2604086 RepID=UPI0011D1AEAA|nr:maleate cis-trans isomerase [Aidingimonas lacisalsi]
MSPQSCLGILLPEDGPTDYEWYTLNASAEADELPTIEVGQIPSDGLHAPGALLALGATERLTPVGERLVNRHGVDAVVWACTSASFIGGLDWARAQSVQLESVLGVPVISTALAFHEALAALGCREVDLLSPYPDEVTRQLMRFLEEGGVAVEHVEALDCTYAADSHQADIVGAVSDFARQYPETTRPLLVPDTAVNTLLRLDTLNECAGRQVLTANQVTLWAGLKRMNWPTIPERFCRALR